MVLSRLYLHVEAREGLWHQARLPVGYWRGHDHGVGVWYSALIVQHVE